MNIRPARLILRCYAEKEGNQWQAFCLDLSLAAQASSFEGAKHKLEQMIVSYVHDALIGEDKAHAEDLLRRRAPLIYWLKFYFYRFLFIQNKIRRLFTEPLPLPINQHYNHA